MIKKLLFRLLAAISNSPEWKYAEYSLQYTLQEVHCLRMSEAESKMQNKSGEFQPLGYAETNTLGKTQNNSGKTETLNRPILKPATQTARFKTLPRPNNHCHY